MSLCSHGVHVVRVGLLSGECFGGADLGGEQEALGKVTGPGLGNGLPSVRPQS